MPKPVRKKPPLYVLSRVWDQRITFRDRSGKNRVVQNYEEAREYAARHGYNGIRITYGDKDS